MNLISISAAFPGGKKDNDDNCLPTIEVEFSEDGESVYVESSKDLSNVVLQFCDGTRDYKFDNLDQGKTGTFSSDGKSLDGVWVKSGCNGSEAGPGYGEFFDNDCPECLEEVDECGVCGGSGKDECGTCDGSIVKDECGVCGGKNEDKGCDGVCFSYKEVDACGVCGGPGEGPCGCDLEITRDECGICGGSGKNECDSCDQSVVKDECGVCGGNGPGECGCDLNVVKDECGVCGGPGAGPCGCNSEQSRDECGVCGGDGPGECGCDFSVVKDECGVCGGTGKDQCGLCPEESGYNKGKDFCGRCPQDSDYESNNCLDCAGIPFGTHVVSSEGECCEFEDIDSCGVCKGPGKDECGVCAGSGPGECGCDLTLTKDECDVCGGKNECLCQEQETPIELDIFSNSLLRLANKTVRAYRSKVIAKKGFLPKKLRDELTAQLETLKAKHIDTWTSVWQDFGATVKVCPDETKCQHIDLKDLITKIGSNFQYLFDITEKYARKTSKLGKKKLKSKINKLLVRASRLKKDADILTTWLPTRKTVCD